MASLALGIVGAAVGGFVGGPFGASLGWAIGSGVGQIVAGTSLPGQKISQEGSRITDLKVMTSTYGNMIPIVYGVMRVAGNVIWATDIIETRHVDTQEQDSGGGKGGGPDTSTEVTTTTYTYAANLGIALCEGEIAGVRRIWANGRLVYDVGDNNTNLVSSFGVNTGGTVRIYTGSETQTADPLIQAYQGAENTPAFRGLAYVVFENLQLASFGNAIPNLTFEVVTKGNFFNQGVRIPTTGSYALIMFNPIDSQIYSCDVSNGNVYKINLNTNTVIASGNAPALIGMTEWLYDNINSKIYARTGAGYYQVDTTTFLTTFAWNSTAFTRLGGYPTDVIQIIDTSARRMYGSSVTVSGTTPTSRLNVMSGTKPSNANSIFQYQFGGNDIRLKVLDAATGILWGDNTDASVAYPSLIGNWNVRSGNGQPAHVLTIPHTSTVVAGAVSMVIDSLSHRLFVYYSGDGGQAYICKIDLGSKSIVSTTAVPSANGGNIPIINTQERNIFYISSSRKIIHFSLDSDTYIEQNYPFTQLNNIISSAYDPNTDSELWGGTDFNTGTGVFRYLGLRLTPDAYSLASIVEDLCTRVNLTSSDLNLSLLTGDVTGYFISNISTVRACLQQLMQVFYFDATESDNKIKFVPRGQSPALTISKDNLGAYTYAGTISDIVTITRAQDLDLPREVDVVYLNANQNYEQGTQYSRRIDKQNKKIIAFTFPISMDDTKGKEVADVLLYDAWTGRTTYEFWTTLAYLALEPTDVISIVNNNATYTVRITQKEQDAGILKFVAVDELAAVYTQNNPGSPSIDINDSISFPSPTQLYYMDIPCLRDTDDSPGVYLGAVPTNSHAIWNGAKILRSLDNGNSYQEVTTFFAPTTSGMCSTVLGNWTGENMFDNKNTVTIVMISGQLSSISEVQALNGSNLALLGNELIIFKDAELIDDGVYLLSGILRGRFGTEQYISTHTSPERFSLLDAAIHRYTETVNDINSTYLYRAITFSNDLFSAPNLPETDTGVCLKPLSGVHIKGSRDLSLNLTITWVRRTRIGGGWNDYADVPLGETTEAYEIDIYNGSDVVRTLTSTTTSVIYTAADQTIDFGSPQAAIDIIIYQMSSTVGRGFGAQETV